LTRRLVYSRKARADLEEILDFLGALDPRRALAYVEGIRLACRSLCENPDMGVSRADLRFGLRVFPYRRRIVIAYEVLPGRVRVLRILGAGRDYEAITGGSDKPGAPVRQ
jgi:toxin ParE1/3/4